MGVDRLDPGFLYLHMHSTFHSPELLVAGAYRNGVNVLALTDHDTMAAVPAAVQAARRHGIRVILDIEISGEHITRHVRNPFFPDETLLQLRWRDLILLKEKQV